MHRTLTRAALSLPLAGALILGALATATPAGATAPRPLRSHVETATPATAAHPAAHAVAPLSKGYVEISAPDGTFSYDQGTVTATENTDIFNEYASVTLTLHTPEGSFILEFAGGATPGPQPGQVYGEGTTQSGQVWVTGPTPGTSCEDTGTTWFESDQIGWQHLGGGVEPSPAAFQFFCEVPDGSGLPGAGDDFAGAVAFNVLPTTPGEGYYEYESDGLLTGFGNDNYLIYLGDLSATSLNLPVVGMATTPDDAGYWMVSSDGGIFAYGDAQFYGSMGGKPLNEPIVGIASTPDGRGYWEVASDGGLFSFGDAQFYGSMGGKALNEPIVGIAAAPGGRGYWEVASDGGIFAFGRAPFYGSTGSIHLNKPVVAMVPSPDGLGYWFVASDGGIFNYGDAHFHGSTGSLHLAEPIVGMAATPSGGGYWLAAADGGIFAFDAPFAGSLGGLGLDDVVGIVK